MKQKREAFKNLIDLFIAHPFKVAGVFILLFSGSGAIYIVGSNKKTAELRESFELALTQDITNSGLTDKQLTACKLTGIEFNYRTYDGEQILTNSATFYAVATLSGGEKQYVKISYIASTKYLGENLTAVKYGVELNILKSLIKTFEKGRVDSIEFIDTDQTKNLYQSSSSLYGAGSMLIYVEPPVINEESGTISFDMRTFIKNADYIGKYEIVTEKIQMPLSEELQSEPSLVYKKYVEYFNAGQTDAYVRTRICTNETENYKFYGENKNEINLFFNENSSR